MKTVIEMAREAGLLGPYDTEQDIVECGIEVWLFGERGMKTLERFAALVRADERNRTWTQEHWTEYERSIAAAEREACIEACWALELNDWEGRAACITAIRARGNT